MKFDKLKHISDLRIREMNLMKASVGIVIAGGVVTAATNFDDPAGLILMYCGLYCASVAQEYRSMADKFIINEKENVKRLVKLRKDNK